MKLQILVKRINKNLPLPAINSKGDYIDLYSSENVTFHAPILDRTEDDRVCDTINFDIKNVKLGVAMLLPEGTYAELVNRSGTGKKKRITLVNGYGVIDHSFCGNEDEWRFPAMALGETSLQEGESFCQFSVKLSQMATAEQKKAFLESDGVEIVEVDKLPDSENRGGGCIRAEKENIA